MFSNANNVQTFHIFRDVVLLWQSIMWLIHVKLWSHVFLNPSKHICFILLLKIKIAERFCVKNFAVETELNLIPLFFFLLSVWGSKIHIIMHCRQLKLGLEPVYTSTFRFIDQHRTKLKMVTFGLTDDYWMAEREPMFVREHV